MAGSFSPECNQGDDKSCKISYIFRMKEREGEGKKSERKFLLVKMQTKRTSLVTTRSHQSSIYFSTLSLSFSSESFSSFFSLPSLHFNFLLSPTTFINITCMRWFFLSILLFFFSFVRNQKLSCKKLFSLLFPPGSKRE